MLVACQVSVGDDYSDHSHIDTTVYHLLSLKLMSTLHCGDEHIAYQLISTVVFNVDFLQLVLLALCRLSTVGVTYIMSTFCSWCYLLYVVTDFVSTFCSWFYLLYVMQHFDVADWAL